MTGEKQNDSVPTRSVLAMSVGNTISALFGGFGGCGLIPQTVLKSGGGGPFSSISMLWQLLPLSYYWHHSLTRSLAQLWQG